MIQLDLWSWTKNLTPTSSVVRNSTPAPPKKLHLRNNGILTFSIPRPLQVIVVYFKLPWH